MVTVEFESHPDARLNIRYFANVSNAAEIGELIRAGDRIPETTALITATLVPDVMLVTVAADKALRAHKAGKLATRTLGSEVVFNISGSRHIRESLRRFGVPADCQHVLMAWFTGATFDKQEAGDVGALIKGEERDLAALTDAVDAAKVKKYYKIQDEELNVGSLTDAVAFRIGCKEYL